MKFAYADPPYLGQAHRYPENEEVDHQQLISDLEAQYPDGWALSCSSPSLQVLLPMCPSTIRVMAWIKPFAIFKPNVGLAYAWEPVLLQGGRRRTREQETVRDWVSVNITLKRGLVGAKPEAFSFWLFETLGMVPGDEFKDLYPGTGGVTAAWEKWQRQLMPSIAKGIK